MEILNMVFILLASRCVGGKIANLALYKPAVTSSLTYAHRPAENAVDENLGTDIIQDTCTVTNGSDPAPFWMVDLQATFSIISVMLTNKLKYSNRLVNFAIDIFTKNPLRNAAAVPVLCNNYTGAPLESSEIRNFTCSHPITGRFVRIKKWKLRFANDLLGLCDVQVFGEVTDCRPRITLYKKQGTRMRSQNMPIKNNYTSVECASYCQRNGGCVAFNYNLDLETCEFVLDPRFEDELESNSDWSYYGEDL